MENQDQTKKQFVADVRAAFGELRNEISERNKYIDERDKLIYDDYLEKKIDIPVGHDHTPVNWLRRTVEIHKNMFMNRGFQVISTYDSQDASQFEGEEQERIKIENRKEKQFAETRKNFFDALINDNGGWDFWGTLAENASAVGDAVIKAWYDDKNKKYVFSQVEAVENVWALWSHDNFRSTDAIAFIHQVSKLTAIRDYGAPQNVATSPLGSPLEVMGASNYPLQPSGQPMVTIFEVAGLIRGWKSVSGSLQKCKIGEENELNATIIGETLTKLVDEPKKLPKYYILPNKRVRRRPWGVSDVSDPAVNINLTYIETLSDWRTVGSKVNFPKYKAYNFGEDTNLPKYQSRRIQLLPLAEGQDIVELTQGSANNVDYLQQMNELKEQFVRETGISRVLFDDPSVTLNSNQALLTSMKPTSDIAEAKKQLWAPIIIQIFKDAAEKVSQWVPELKEILEGEYDLRIMWPSIMQKEDPVYQQMLLNRWNAGTMSLISYLEQQGETKEEIDRIRDELDDPVTAAIYGKITNVLAQGIVAPPSDSPEPKVSVNLRGDLTPQQEGNLATQAGFNDGPFPASMGPQGGQGLVAGENADNAGFLTGDPYNGGTPINRGPDGQPVGMQTKDTNTGQDARPQVNTQANNRAGTGAVSQPGSGATPVSAGGAVNQAAQQGGA